MKKFIARFFLVNLAVSGTECFAQEWGTVPAIFAKEEPSQSSELPPKKENSSKLFLDDGFYVGVGGGYDAYTIRRVVHAEILDEPLFDERTHISPQGFIGTFFLGYGYTFKQLAYIGIEGFSNLSTANSKTNTTVSSNMGPFVYNTNITTFLSYGVSLLPGVKVIDSSLIYLRVGFIQTCIKEKETECLTTSFNGVPFLECTKHHYANGLSLGLGFEQAVYWHLSLRGEFIHTFYSSFTNHYASVVSETEAKLRPSNNQFILSLIWHIW